MQQHTNKLQDRNRPQIYTHDAACTRKLQQQLRCTCTSLPHHFRMHAFQLSLKGNRRTLASHILEGVLFRVGGLRERRVKDSALLWSALPLLSAFVSAHSLPSSPKAHHKEYKRAKTQRSYIMGKATYTETLQAGFSKTKRDAKDSQK